MGSSRGWEVPGDGEFQDYFCMSGFDILGICSWWKHQVGMSMIRIGGVLVTVVIKLRYKKIILKYTNDEYDHFLCFCGG